ncbi:hypothetical protein AgCh_031935 [Apium graveolens]
MPLILEGKRHESQGDMSLVNFPEGDKDSGTMQLEFGWKSEGDKGQVSRRMMPYLKGGVNQYFELLNESGESLLCTNCHCNNEASQEWTDLPTGMKFNPTDVELLDHLAAKCRVGKIKPVMKNGVTKGYKKILVLYSTVTKGCDPVKTKWVMHQYHLGTEDDKNEDEYAVSKEVEIIKKIPLTSPSRS